MLASDFARSKTTYWYGFKDVKDGVENAGAKILNPNQAGGTGIYLGTVSRVKKAPDGLIDEVKKNAAPDADPASLKIQMAMLSGGNYAPDPGDSIRLHSKDDSGRTSHKVRSVEIDDDGHRWIDIPLSHRIGDSVYLLQIKSMSKRYSKVLPGDLSKFRKQPADEKLPFLDVTPVEGRELSYFPEGLYVQVSTIDDVFLAQSLHPVRLIIEFTCDTKYDLLNGKTVLPISKKSIYISLDPYCPASKEEELCADLETLIEKGYSNFVVNNIAQIQMLKGKKVHIIAGPYLYTFNRWAVSFFENQDIGAFIMPYEDSRKNLEATFDQNVRARVLVPVFAYPALFRIRFKLPEDDGFTYFSDKEEGMFKVVSSDDGSFVMPELPFSLLDKTEFLSQAGFKKILVDFSKTKLSKGQIKNVSSSLFKKQPFPEVNRFNWKDGFYNPQQIEEYKASNERAAAARLAQKQGGSRKPKVRGGSVRAGKKTLNKKY